MHAARQLRQALVKMCTLPLLAGENGSARFVVPTVAASVDLVVHLGIDVHALLTGGLGTGGISASALSSRVPQNPGSLFRRSR